MSKRKIIEAIGLSFGYGNSSAISDVSFEILKRDFVGLIGPNGSGKTTLLKLLLGIIPPSRGKILLFGEPLDSFSDWSRIGYVPQKATAIDPSFPATVREIVFTGLVPAKKFPKSFAKGDEKLIIRALKLVGMEKRAGSRIGELSGGQQQRVMIAKALVYSPELLFLDEPTTGIDPATQKSFYSLLGSLNKRGLTIVLVTHDTGKITGHVNKIAYLNQRMEFYGTHSEFCARDKGHDKQMHQHALCLDRSVQGEGE